MRKTSLKTRVIAGLAVGLMTATSSQAAVISYYLDQSNQLADGINYLQVTISDEREAGVIDFTVQVLQPLLDIAGSNFGIQKFGFNVLGGVGAEAADVTLLPDGWRARNSGRMDGFGLFDMTTQGTGKNRTNTLTFSIAGIDFDTVQSYVDLSTGRTPQGFSLFAVHVAGFNLGNCDGGDKGGDDKGGDDDKKGPSGTKSTGDGGSCVTSAFFGGNASAVPAPPAVWLLGTGIAGLVLRRFRQGRGQGRAIAA